jgi:Ca2+-binding RTX toxin-like protein
VTIKATDSLDELNPVSLNLVVNIGNVNESPTAVVYTPTPTIMTISELASTTTKTAVGTYTVTDDALGNNLVSLSGADQSLFTLSGGTVYLKAGAALNFETNPSLDFALTVKDAEYGSVPVTTATFKIVVDDVDPLFVATLPSVIEGNSKIGNVVNPLGDTVGTTYTLTGADATLFSISATGDLSFKSAPNFDAPLDKVGVTTKAGDNLYEVTVNAKDSGVGNTVTKAYVIAVTDTNDLAPAMPSSSTVTVKENTLAVGTFSAVDADTTGEPIVYSIIGADAALFSINSKTGSLAFLAPPDFETKADVDANNVYDVVVKASDGVNSSNQTVAVTVTNVNDNAPVFTSPATKTVNENATAIMTVVATDADNLAAVTYTLTGGADQAKFAITSAGVLTFVAGQDFETPGDAGANNIYDVLVTASDGLNKATQSIAVTVADANDIAPVFTSANAAKVVEGNTAVLTVVTTDTDTTGNVPNYTIFGGADAGFFNIDASTGVLEFKAAPDFDANADAGGNNVYDVIVKASDGVKSTTQAIAVTLTDINDTAPVITTLDKVTANENQVVAAALTSTDKDTVGGPTTFSITGGVDAALFTIVGGELQFITAPDFETKADVGNDGKYDVQVTATDGVNPTVKDVVVTVADVNEAPTGLSVTLLDPAVISELDDISAGLKIATVAITDDLLGTEVISVSGANAGLLEVKGNDIYIKAGTVLSPETFATFDFVVDVEDESLGSKISSVIQSITLTDVAPDLVGKLGNLNENVVLVGNVVDVGADKTNVAYTLTGLDDDALFTIDVNGNLSFKVAPDFEIPSDTTGDNTYVVTVTADDGLTSVNQTYTFDILDVLGVNKNGTAIAETLNGTVEADTLDGLAGNDIINGLGGNDIITGGTGADTMNGGTGNDTYYVDHISDRSVEALNAGIDTVNSKVTYTLGVNVENLNLTGAINQNGTGNILDNRLVGNSLVNILNGAAGNDTLTGGLGKDTLTGGTGNDTFDFNDILESKARPNHDVITDFSNGDLIDLSDISGVNSIGGISVASMANSVTWALVGANTIVSIDTNGIAGADMEIQLNGNKLAILDATDFIL